MYNKVKPLSQEGNVSPNFIEQNKTRDLLQFHFSRNTAVLVEMQQIIRHTYISELAQAVFLK
jgi:hypothetical protein